MYEELKITVVFLGDEEIVRTSNDYTEGDWEDDNADGENGWT